MRRLLPLLLLLLGACGEEEILHGLEEAQANQVLVALSEAGIAARKARADGNDGGWTVSVTPREAGRAQRALAERELPRPKAPGFAEVFGKGSMVPTPTEERALYHHALAGELARSIEAIDGVVEARVHIALPSSDPLRPEAPRLPRAAVLVKCRPESRARLEALSGGIRSLVAGAAEGLEPTAVAVVIAEGATGPLAPTPGGRSGSPLLLALGAVAGLLGLALGAAAIRGLPWRARAS
jgi:type III secretion protein J